MKLSKQEKALIIDALGKEIMNQKRYREEWEADGNMVVVKEINDLCDDLIDIQNRVRDA